MKTNQLQKNIPNEWQIMKLDEVSDITNGKTNSQDAVEDGEYPLFDRSVLIKRSDKYLFDNTAVILPGEGAEFIPRFYSGKFDLHQRAYAIFPDKKIVDSKYIYYVISSKNDILVKNSVGSTVKSLRLPMIQSMAINIPPKPEQEKIAEILSKVDEDIEKTAGIIEETEKLKRGLTRELLTKGVKTKDWETVQIKKAPLEMIDGDRGVNYPKQTDFSNDDFCLFLTNKNVKNDSFDFSESQFISKENDSKLRKGKLNRYDCILTTRGTVGTVAFYDSNVIYENIRINSGMLIFRTKAGFDPRFLYQLLKSEGMKKKYRDMASGSAQPQLPIGSLENILISYPKSINEQKEIAEILSSIDEKISINKKLKEKLTQLKKGLMSDLLSGKVRTTEI